MIFSANRGLTCKMYGDSAAKVNSHQFSVRPPERASAWIFKRFSQTVSCWCPLQSAFAAESDLLVYSPPSHFCCRSLARTSVLLSEVDSDRRAARGSRAWPLAGSGARAGGSGPGARARPASRRTMSHGHWNNFRMIAGSHPAPDMHACIQDFPTDAWMRC